MLGIDAAYFIIDAPRPFGRLQQSPLSLRQSFNRRFDCLLDNIIHRDSPIVAGRHPP